VRRPVVLVAVAALATVAAVVVGVLTLDDDAPEATGAAPEEPAFSTTALAGYDTTTSVVARGPFCDRIDERQVDAVLGSVPAPVTWENGDPVDVGTGSDVGHEFGCSYAVAEAGEARAWVFAPPVDVASAQRFVTSAGKGPGCVAADGPPFGNPTLALTCTARDGVQRASYRGLFGDAWLVCEVVRPAAATWDAADRAGRWCVGVLEAAGPQD
jgi:hypothetical protein